MEPDRDFPLQGHVKRGLDDALNLSIGMVKCQGTKDERQLSVSLADGANPPDEISQESNRWPWLVCRSLRGCRGFDIAIEAKTSDIAHFERKLRPGLNHQNSVYAAMVKSLDDSVGRVLARLKKRGLDRSTLVIFTSDNGGYLGTDKRQTMPVTSNAPLRSGKGTLYEGGLRVPLIVKWPGVTPVGAECGEPVALTDLFYTLVAAAGLPKPTNSPADGLDLTRLLKRQPRKARKDTENHAEKRN